MLWGSLSLQGMTLRQKLAIFGPLLQRELKDLTNLAGIILSPGAYVGAGGPQEAGNPRRIEALYGIAVSCPFPWGWFNETIVVPCGGMPNAEAALFADWYQDEFTWLNWALERQGLPPFDELVREKPDTD
jgi:hypothetical protein